jgi:histidinol-phosphate aminotransferase
MTNPLLARFRQDIQSMHAYAIQDARGLIKLDAMENPFALPPHLQRQLGERLGKVALNRYPVDCVAQTRAAVARYARVPSGCELMLGNGSDELISLLALACDVPGAVILAPVPCFVMYAMSAQFQGMTFVPVELTAQFELDVKSMVLSIATHKPAITYLAYPNNPTANAYDVSDVEEIIAACRAVNGLVVMDEAYQPFAHDSYITRMGKPGYEHVLLMRTLSKFGLAGVRLGYLIGDASLIAQIDKVRPPYNISALNCEAALFALEHEAEFARQAAVIKAERTVLSAHLMTLPGVTVFDSQANMILVRVPDADTTFASLKQRGVLVKNASKMHPLLHNCLRLTVGAPEENVALLRALKESL